MIYNVRAASALRKNHPEFWREIQTARPGENAMLMGYWSVFLKQAQKKRLGPDSAANKFVESTRYQPTFNSL